MKIFSAKESKELDDYTVIKESVSHLDLMERAASSVTYEIISRWRRNTPVVVFAGPGNNGGDALAVARMLIDEGYTVMVYLFNTSKSLSTCCEKNLERLEDMGVEVTEVVQTFMPPDLTRGMLVIDGLFGAGLNRPLSGGFVSLVKYINESEADVLSIDMPSGLYSEDNRSNYNNTIVNADITVSFQYPKLCFMFKENAPYVGEWRIADIGISQAIIDKKETPYYYLEAEEVARLLMPRNRFSDKRDYGHLLIMAGSVGMMGAAVMSAKAALRAGAGLVSVHSAGCGEEILQTSVPEAMYIPDTNMNHITNFAVKPSHTVVAAGPGLGRHKDTVEAISYLLNKTNLPMVIDADAINLLATNKSLISRIPERSILTPHPKEFDRIAGESASGYERLMKAKAFAVENHLIVVLKGAYTAICTTAGNIYFNSCGNPGMATAGSGDVLTGIILGLLAQGYEPETAAVMGVFIHGTAGDLAAIYQSEESLIASDIIDMLGKAFKQVK